VSPGGRDSLAFASFLQNADPGSTKVSSSGQLPLISWFLLRNHCIFIFIYLFYLFFYNFIKKIAEY
jgi:hypothetical protein